jgi:hypothetical protein
MKIRYQVELPLSFHIWLKSILSVHLFYVENLVFFDVREYFVVNIATASHEHPVKVCEVKKNTRKEIAYMEENFKKMH